jgi:hypothetical protein
MFVLDVRLGVGIEKALEKFVAFVWPNAPNALPK